MKSDSSSALKNLFEIIALSDDPEEISLLFDDLCTNKEIENMASRLYAADLLINGNTYQEIIEKVKISSATLSRVSQCVQYSDGYQLFLGENGLIHKDKK